MEPQPLSKLSKNIIVSQVSLELKLCCFVSVLISQTRLINLNVAQADDIIHYLL